MPNDVNIPRRRLLAGSAGLAVFAALPAQAVAVTTAEAEAYVDKLVREVLAVVNSGLPEATVLKKFGQTFRRYGDVAIIARSSLGVAWRRATPSPRSAYTDAFSTKILNKYGRQFSSYRGATFTITGSRDFGRKGILVQSEVKQRGEAPFEIEWQLSDRSGSLKVFNLIVEGVSMLSTAREEVGVMLEKRGGDIDKLIAHLKAAG
ncbi:MAG: phospholipid-binding protein MlaC [Paracoccaceae bacterium]